MQHKNISRFHRTLGIIKSVLEIVKTLVELFF